MMMTSLKRKKVENNPQEKEEFNIEARSQLDSEIARAFYSGGLPFHYTRNPHFIRSYILVATSNLAGYIPPTYNALRTTLL